MLYTLIGMHIKGGRSKLGKPGRAVRIFVFYSWVDNMWFHLNKNTISINLIVKAVTPTLTDNV